MVLVSFSHRLEDPEEGDGAYRRRYATAGSGGRRRSRRRVRSPSIGKGAFRAFDMRRGRGRGGSRLEDKVREMEGYPAAFDR